MKLATVFGALSGRSEIVNEPPFSSSTQAGLAAPPGGGGGLRPPRAGRPRARGAARLSAALDADRRGPRGLPAIGRRVERHRELRDVRRLAAGKERAGTPSPGP